MIKMSYRKDGKQVTKTVFILNINVEDIQDTFSTEDVHGWTKRGFAIFVEDIGRKQGIEGVKRFFDTYHVKYDVEESVPVGTADEYTKAAKDIRTAGISLDELKAFIASKRK